MLSPASSSKANVSSRQRCRPDQGFRPWRMKAMTSSGCRCHRGEQAMADAPATNLQKTTAVILGGSTWRMDPSATPRSRPFPGCRRVRKRADHDFLVFDGFRVAERGAADQDHEILALSPGRTGNRSEAKRCTASSPLGTPWMLIRMAWISSRTTSRPEGQEKFSPCCRNDGSKVPGQRRLVRKFS